MSDLRWQGHSHEELFEQINEGPGADGSTESVHRWRQLTRALNEIDEGLADALAAATSGWTGAAADSAHDGLRPLGDWARQAQEAAELMRERAEQQAEFVSKARNDMPEPVAVSAEEPGAVESLLTHLVGAQSDYEVQEARRDAAEQRAFEVMRGYESSTTANTTALASFAAPPQVVVDSPPSAGLPGSPGSSGAPGSGSGQGITLSWGGMPASPMPPRAGGANTGGTPGIASRGGTFRGSGTTGSPSASGGSSPAGPSSSTAGHPSSGPAGARPTSSAPSTSGPSTSGPSTSPPSTSGPTSTSPSGPRGAERAGEDDEQVDREVTEQSGDPGGFFEQPRTSSRPVIGGEPE